MDGWMDKFLDWSQILDDDGYQIGEEMIKG